MLMAGGEGSVALVADAVAVVLGEGGNVVGPACDAVIVLPLG
jgi:hypothetical protein